MPNERGAVAIGGAAWETSFSRSHENYRELHVSLWDPKTEYLITTNESVTVPVSITPSIRATLSDYSISCNQCVAVNNNTLNVTIPAFHSSATIRVTAQPDDLHEYDEDLSFDLKSNITNAARSPKSVPRKVTIKDTDIPSVFFTDFSVPEAWEGGTASVTVGLSNPSEKKVTVTIGKLKSSTAENSDYNFGYLNEPFTFEQGETLVSLLIDVNKNRDGTLFFRDRSDLLKLYIKSVKNAAFGLPRQHTIKLHKTSKSNPFDPKPPPSPTSVVTELGKVPDVTKIDILPLPPDSAGSLVVLSSSGVPTAAPFKVAITGGYLEGSTTFFDANKNGIADFLDINSDGIQGDADPTEPVGVSTADGTLLLSISAGFDSNGNNIIDPDEGQMVVTGGADGATLLPFVGQFTAVPGQFLLSPISTIMNKLVSEGFTVSDARQRVIKAFPLPEGIDLHTMKADDAAVGGAIDGALLYAAKARLFNTTVQTANVFADASGAPPINVLVDLAYEELTAKIVAAKSIFDPSVQSNIESLLVGISFAIGPPHQNLWVNSGSGSAPRL